MRLLIALLLAVVPLGAAAHTMSPASQKIFVANDTTYVKYTVTNKFPWPATFVMEILEKDQKTLFTEWESLPQDIKLLDGRDTDVYLKIDTTEERKLVVCSKLHKVGYNETNARTITRVCTRLWLYR